MGLFCFLCNSAVTGPLLLAARRRALLNMRRSRELRWPTPEEAHAKNAQKLREKMAIEVSAGRTGERAAKKLRSNGLLAIRSTSMPDDVGLIGGDHDYYPEDVPNGSSSSGATSVPEDASVSSSDSDSEGCARMDDGMPPIPSHFFNTLRRSGTSGKADKVRRKREGRYKPMEQSKSAAFKEAEPRLADALARSMCIKKDDVRACPVTATIVR